MAMGSIKLENLSLQGSAHVSEACSIDVNKVDPTENYCGYSILYVGNSCPEGSAAKSWLSSIRRFNDDDKLTSRSVLPVPAPLTITQKKTIIPNFGILCLSNPFLDITTFSVSHSLLILVSANDTLGPQRFVHVQGGGGGGGWRLNTKRWKKGGKIFFNLLGPIIIRSVLIALYLPPFLKVH